jgi:hypothetical protein
MSTISSMGQLPFNYCKGDKMKKAAVSRTCNTHEGNKKCK